MGDFGEFYRQGGVFMHFITVMGMLGTAGLTAYRFAPRLRFDPEHLLRWTERTALLCLLLGVLGSAFGFFDVAGALRTIEPGATLGVEFAQFAFRGMAIASSTTAYGLMWAIPLLFAGGLMRLRVRDAQTSIRVGHD